MGVLRSLGAQHMYTRTSKGSIHGASVIDFLIDDDDFPRAVAHCLTRLGRILATLPRHDDALDGLGEVRDLLEQRHRHVVEAKELHEWVDTVQLGLGSLHTRLTGTYFVPETSRDLHPSGRVVV